jgi:hypothetical protein
MIKLTANLSKKVPMPDVEFSSQSYSAGIEVELASAATHGEVREELRKLYALLEEAIDQQVAGIAGENGRRGSAVDGKESPPSHPRQGAGRRPATEAQVRAIQAIARERGHSDENLRELIASRFGPPGEPSELSVAEASSLIDTLKGDGKA